MAAPAILQSCSKDDGMDDSGGNNNGGNNNLVASVDLNSGDFASLKNAGSYAYKGNILIVNNGGSYMAFSSICTHQSCTVKWDNNSMRIVCDCHGSVFNTSGAVVNGPAPMALKKYSITKNGEILEIR